MVLASTSEIAINPSLYAGRINYDTIKDLLPVALVATTPMVVIATPGLPVQSIPELIALARARPGELNAASAGAGTISHLAGELFRSTHGLRWSHVAYKGTGPALTDLTSGQVQLMFVPPPPVMGLVKAGRVRLLAVSSRNRAPILPDTPTVMEAAGPEYVVDNWYGIFLPAGTPREIVTRLGSEIARSLEAPDLISTLAAQGAAPGAMAAAPFADYVKSEVEKWTRVVKASGAKAD